MGFSTARALSPSLQVVDLSSVHASEVERFLELETTMWRDRLHWDVTPAVAALRRALERGGVFGKAVRFGPDMAAFAYYSLEGGRAIVSGFQLAPEWTRFGSEADRPEWARLDVARTALAALMKDLRRRGVRRVETQFIGFDAPWLVPCFEAEGFRTHWRDFLRLPLPRRVSEPGGTDGLELLPWRAWNLSEAALVMHGAHASGVDSDMNELYRTSEGCRVLLGNIVRQRGCGTPLAEASAVGRERRTDRMLGFALVTETAGRQAHLAQLAVAPSSQRRGIGRRLLDRSVARLQELGFDAVSLMVSSGNVPAFELYRSFGFAPVFRFPVFSWDR